jgi:multidrug efflux pump subunit AcrB
MLIVGWFQNFKTPIVMMLRFLSLIGIVFGHWLLELISQQLWDDCLGRVMVRNSVLLIDFIEIRLNDGEPLKQAIIEAGAVRTSLFF